jgi:signal transduction histidine kinase
LGLEICRRIVTRAGGWIEIESAPGIGSIVRVVLPASQTRSSASAA